MKKAVIGAVAAMMVLSVGAQVCSQQVTDTGGMLLMRTAPEFAAVSRAAASILTQIMMKSATVLKADPGMLMQIMMESAITIPGRTQGKDTVSTADTTGKDTCGANRM